MEPSARHPGPDVVRALAMLGVLLINYHGYLILRGGRRDGGAVYDFFDPWNGPLATRFAATFVLTAGVGVTLLTNSSLGDATRRTEMRWLLVRRGLLLYAGGLLFDFVWQGTILPFYGAMFVLAAGIFTLRTRWVVAIGVGAALAGWLINWWRYEHTLDGNPPDWLTDSGPRSPRGLLFDVFVNGTHPLLPWLIFLCAGIVLGRLLTTSWWRPAATGTGFALYTAAQLAAASARSDRWIVVLSDDPWDRGVAYAASALGTALLAFTGISWLAERFRATRPIDVLRRAGQMSLSIYLAHALVFNLLVDELELVEPGGLTTALVMTGVFWVTAIAAAGWYQRRYGRGPAELLYRRLTA
ncbi:MAG TPA: DUF418 domain-containing protein [Ilumatobacter sp.]